MSRVRCFVLRSVLLCTLFYSALRFTLRSVLHCTLMHSASRHMSEHFLLQHLYTSFPNSSGREMNHMVSRPQAAPYLNSNLKVQSFPPAIHPLNQLVIFSPLHIVGVEQMVGQMPVGLSQVLVIELHQIRVLMGFAQHLALILTVESV